MIPQSILFWDELAPFDLIPYWAVDYVAGCRIAKIPGSILSITGKTMEIGCKKCNQTDASIVDFSPSVPKIEFQNASLSRSEICFGYEDGTSILCGFVWRGKCPQCGTEYAAVRKATPDEQDDY